MTRTGAAPLAAWLSPLGAGALSALLFAASVLVPPFGFLLALASPLPVARAACLGGLRGALGATAGGLLIAVGLVGVAGAAAYVTQFALGGCALGFASQRLRRADAVVASYVLPAVAAFWLLVALMAAREGMGPAAFVQATLDRSLDQAVQFFLQAEADAETALAVQAWAEQTGRFLGVTFPGLFAALAVLTGWFNAALLRRLAGHSAGEPWTQWRAPESWIWGLIGSGLAGLLLGGPLGAVGLNVFLVAATVYFLQGLAIVQCLFEARGFPRLFRGAAYALLFLQLPVMLLVAGVGAVDLWVDFRSRWAKPPEPPGSEARRHDSSP